MDDFGGPATGRIGPGALLAGRYRLEERLGRGGMGTVWRAADERMRRPVALKEPELPPGVDDRTRDELCRRMEREAQAAARLRHPGIVRVHDIETVGGLPWLVMELIEGESLEAWFASGTVTVAEAAAIGRQLASALAAVHAAGIVHRDVKPANVMRTPAGELVLTDFGIAQLDGGTDLTRTGSVVGSLPYLSPERVAGLRPGPAADLWALGLVLYEALEGVHPYRRQSAQGTLLAVVQDPLPPPRRAGALTGPVTALLERDPQRRPTAAQAVALFAAPAAPVAPPDRTPTETVEAGRTVRLRAAATSGAPATAAGASPVGAPADRGHRLLRRIRSSRPALAAVTAACLAATGAAGWLALGRDSTPEPRTVPAGFTARSVASLGIGIAVPEGYIARIGADEANWSSPDTLVQIQLRDEGKAVRSAAQYAAARLAEVSKGIGTFCGDSHPAPERFHVRVVHGPQSVLHGDVDGSAIEYAYSTRAEDQYPCLQSVQADEAMEQYMVRDGRVLHFTVSFVWNHREQQKTDPAPANQQLYADIDASLNPG